MYKETPELNATKQFWGYGKLLNPAGVVKTNKERAENLGIIIIIFLFFLMHQYPVLLYPIKSL